MPSVSSPGFVGEVLGQKMGKSVVLFSLVGVELKLLIFQSQH